MEQITDAQVLLNLMDRPAFFVKDGTVTHVNRPAAALFLTTGTPVASLLRTGTQEYQEFTGGCLYLNLLLAGRTMGFSVTRTAGFDVFRLEEEDDNRELQAMALAARELRGPLDSILSTVRRMFPVSGVTDDPTVKNQAARINRGLFQMLRVINNMSDAGQYNADSQDRQEIRDICSVINEIFDKAMALSEFTQVKLTYTGCTEAVYSLTDVHKLERAIYGILSNALKNTPAGGTISAELTHRRDLVCLTVRDSGCGIDDSLRGNIFSQYLRQPGLEDPKFGIGLGMVLIRATAAAHGGTVLVDHPDGCGTRVTMTLAVRQEGGSRVRSNCLIPDGGLDQALIELADLLPNELYLEL